MNESVGGAAQRRRRQHNGDAATATRTSDPIKRSGIMYQLSPAVKPSGAHIVVKGVSHRYRGSAQSALNNINFEVQPGEAVAVVGRSG